MVSPLKAKIASHLSLSPNSALQCLIHHRDSINVSMDKRNRKLLSFVQLKIFLVSSDMFEIYPKKQSPQIVASTKIENQFPNEFLGREHYAHRHTHTLALQQ